MTQDHASKNKIKGKSVEDIYKSLTDHEHILQLPDTWIGGIEEDDIKMWVFDQEKNKMVFRTIKYIPGLYKIFDEIMVNSRDQWVKDKTCNQIKVNIDPETGTIKIWNNGDDGIPVVWHNVEKCYVPEMIFSKIRTSSHYEQTKKITGGKNGVGSKCISIDTLVPLWDGSIKKAVELTSNDILIGDDGTKRHIKNIIKETGKMFKVKQTQAESYKVNDQHILTLYMPEHKTISWDCNESRWTMCWWDSQSQEIKQTSSISKEDLEKLKETISDTNILDISIQDFIKLDCFRQKKLVGLQGQCVQWDQKAVAVDPYLFGKNQLKKYIPKDLIINDQQIRLKLLAGLLDSGCCTQNNDVTLLQELDNQVLVNDIVFLARSLGFRSCYTIENNRFKISISGNVQKIPTLIVKINQNQDTRILTTGQIEIEDLGIGDYVGLETDGNQRFVINDFTVTHNCANIFSTFFNVEVVDSKKKLHYSQNFYDNMYKKSEPVITELKNKKTRSYTQITFTPDYKRFGVQKLSDDMICLFKKRVYDVAAVTNIDVYLNDNHIKIASFDEYIKLFYEDGETPSSPIYEVPNERWKVGVIYDPNSGFRQISYVNGICTFQGGSHVNHVLDQVVGGLHQLIVSKNKNLKIKTATIKENLTFFIDCCIEDPAFSSQTKEFLTNKIANFGSKCEISDIFIKNLAKTGIVDDVVNFAKFRALEELKKTDGKKKANLKGLAKLHDAHWAGTKKSQYCTLILTEGDSAKSYAVAGTEVVGKDRYGVFPLRGKLLNVREATAKQLMDNEEIKNIKKIMGLRHNKKYKNVKQLRYGRIMILTDQDFDGSHIKGLIMNFIHYFWPSLIKIKGFIVSMKTPIIKIWKTNDIKKNNPLIFYTMSSYEQWKKEIGDNIKKFTKPKYYKGLGTSTDEEAKVSFENIDGKTILYMWDGAEENINNDTETITPEDISEDDVSEDDTEELDKSNECYDKMTLAFSKNRANDRKKWLQNYDKDLILENDHLLVSYKDFIDKDLKHFSNYDNMRSIPFVGDGFKPSQRKIMYGSFLRKIYKEEIKVAQLSGYISDKTGYHHGENSLQMAIISMAQNFVGSNNINWLLPIGNFGNRAEGGHNAASARYIYTQLNELVNYTFRDEDKCIYVYADDDGTPVEPVCYAPIICNTLVNGIQGIGTGFSTEIPSFNPIDIINNLKRLILGKDCVDMKPFYQGFTGKITMTSSNNFETVGLYEILDENTVVIEELPVGTWTSKYKKELEEMLVDDIKSPKKGQIFKKIIDDSGNNTVKFTVVFMEDVLQELIKKGELIKKLKLVNKHTMTNMHLYDLDWKIKKYDNVKQILIDYYKFRLSLYEKRKEYYLKKLEHKLAILSWKIKFINDCTTGKIVVIENKKARTKENVIQQLVDLKYPKLAPDFEAQESEKTYNYLTSITIFALTEEEKNDLMKEHANKLSEFTIYKNTPPQDIWMKELEELETHYNKWVKSQIEIPKKNNKKKVTKKKK